MKTQCPNCKAKFNINETSVGKQAKCPKCAKPFTIEPFVETPVAVVTPVQNSKPAVPSVKSPEPVAPPVNIANPVAPPIKSPAPVKPPAPIAPSVKSPLPVVPTVKIAAPIAPAPVSAEPKKQEQPESKVPSKAVLSKALFVYCWIGVRIIMGVLGALGLMLTINKGAKSTLIAAFAAADVFLICSVAIEYALFYKMWAAIQDDKVSISPSKAVGFLFIPVFNIYWALLVVTGFAEDYDSFMLRRSIKAKELPMSLYLIYAFAFMLSETVLTVPMLCVFAFLRLIYVAFIDYTVAAWALLVFLSAAAIAHFVTYIFFAIKTCNAVNALPERQDR
jgi:predicted Zn finger-like uncharacterized protein